jgi:pentatricopeptide repeat protein
MQRAGVPPDAVTYNTLLSVCAKTGEGARALQVRRRRRRRRRRCRRPRGLCFLSAPFRLRSVKVDVCPLRCAGRKATLVDS